jgi:superfamily II DNA/RNA helicase
VLDYEMDQITASDSETKRDNILNKFKDGKKIQLLFSIRILDECIDIPKCDSIYITYPSQSKIRTIQRMCRCIRTDKNNEYKVGNVYIWCDEYDKILETLSGIKEYDLFFKDKIKINETDFYGEKKGEGIEVDNKLIEKYVLGIKEFRVLSWEEKLEEVKKYIDKNNERPSQSDKDKNIKKLGVWIGTQQIRYKEKTYIMSNYKIRILWEKFKTDYNEYFLSNENRWLQNLEKVKAYINKNKKKPLESDKDTNIIFLGRWINNQQSKNIKEEKINKIWENFIKEYNEYFLSNEDKWFNNFEKVKLYSIKD